MCGTFQLSCGLNLVIHEFSPIKTIFLQIKITLFYQFYELRDAEHLCTVKPNLLLYCGSCENFSLCLRENIDQIDLFIFYRVFFFNFQKLHIFIAVEIFSTKIIGKILKYQQQLVKAMECDSIMVRSKQQKRIKCFSSLFLSTDLCKKSGIEIF